MLAVYLCTSVYHYWINFNYCKNHTTILQPLIITYLVQSVTVQWMLKVNKTLLFVRKFINIHGLYIVPCKMEHIPLVI